MGYVETASWGERGWHDTGAGPGSIEADFIVEGAGGLGFTSAEEAVRILEAAVLPGFEQLIKLQHQKKILAGGLPVSERASVFILEAASNDEADQIVRGIAFWGAFSSKVTPLQSVAGRAAIERKVVREAEGRR